MAKHELHDGNDDGMSLGADSTQKIGFYGATPVDRPDSVADATDAATAITQCNAIIARLEELGLLTANS